MRTTPATRVRCALAVVVGVLGLCACGASFEAQTNQPYDPGKGVSFRTGEVDVVNALVVADDDGNGTLIASLVNITSTPDSLTSVTAVADETTIEGSLTDGAVELPSLEGVQLVTDNAVVFHDDAIRPGYTVDLQFQFTNGVPVKITVPVAGRLAEFETIDVPTSAPSTPS